MPMNGMVLKESYNTWSAVDDALLPARESVASIPGGYSKKLLDISARFPPNSYFITLRR